MKVKSIKYKVESRGVRAPRAFRYFQLSTFNFQLSTRSGFTLMEVLVSVTIFATVITMMLSMFNYTLRIYRRVEAQRQVSQSVRTTMEYLVKEIRNGQVDYGIVDGISQDTVVHANCRIPTLGADTYTASNVQAIGGRNIVSLGLINVEGERECIYWDNNPDPSLQDAATNNNLYIKKQMLSAVSQLNPSNVKIKYLRLYVRPLRDPFMDSPNLVETMPAVTIVAQVSVTLPTGEVRTVPYQTSVSTYIYDIPSQ
jgi:prepilin-type N-terminal cleavage/methylation domain-containing protein